MKLFTEIQVPAIPVMSPTDLLDDPHLADAGFWDRRETEDGTVRFPGIPTGFSDTPGEIGEPGPALGADNASVLTDYGFGEDEIAALSEKGALLCS